MTKIDAVVLSLLVAVRLCCLPGTVESLGGNNIFGFFRKRRQTLLQVQEKRAAAATHKGFAGPHGGLLNSTEAASLGSSTGSWSPVADWFSQK
jgi:hypothetical protein